MSENEERDFARELAALPREIEPPRDLWVGVAGRIAARRRRSVVARRVVTGTSMLLAAAAVVLSVRAARQPHALPHEGDPARPITSDRIVSVPAHELEEPGALAPEEASYRAALESLTPAFDEQKHELPDEDVRAIEASLRTLGTAIEVTRASLVEHPDDMDLRAELDGEYEQEIDTMNDVLEWTTRS